MGHLPEGKLVRDAIPDIIEKDTGKKPMVIILRGVQLRIEASKKLQEEVNELLLTTTSEEAMEECGDVLEIRAFCERIGCTHGLTLSFMAVQKYCLQHSKTMEDAEAARAKKFAARGGFSRGYYLVKEETAPVPG